MKRYINSAQSNNYRAQGYTRYTVMAWLYDKRYNQDCHLTAYDTDDYDDAMKWISRIKKTWGDSVKLINREDNTEKDILVREDQRMG